MPELNTFPSATMSMSYNGWAHMAIQGWWAPALWRQLGENNESEYSCHWAKGLESLEMRRLLLSSHNGNNYQTEESRVSNGVCFIIQLMLGRSQRVLGVSTAERLSAQLGPAPAQCLMVLPRSEPARSPIRRRHREMHVMQRELLLNYGGVSLQLR